MKRNQTNKARSLNAVSITLLSVAIVAGILTSGCASSTKVAANAVEPEAPTIEERWGVEVVAMRLTGANHMLDFRYKVIDEEKAAGLFDRAKKPVVVHQSSGAALEVPRPAKTGPLRPTNPPEAGRTYFILFSNPGVVHAGDEVTVKIGDFEADVVVE